MRNFRLDDESGHQEALFNWAAYRTGLMPEESEAVEMTNILLGIIALELLAIFSKLDKLEERGRENE